MNLEQIQEEILVLHQITEQTTAQLIIITDSQTITPQKHIIIALHLVHPTNLHQAVAHVQVLHQAVQVAQARLDHQAHALEDQEDN
jgi:co-chaperonin GroES (HSP10)